MFLIAQVIGVFVAFQYLPEISIDPETGEEIKLYNLPYGLDPPEEVSPADATTSIIIALAIAVILMLTLMKLKAELFLRIWFLIVVILGIAIALNAFIVGLQSSAIIAIIVAIPLGILKIFHRNIIVHNLTELLIYPGIATVFIPLFNIFWVVILLFIISIYDMYAVWHAGFMQKMAKYQMEQVKVFSGFLVPYIAKKDKVLFKRSQIRNAKLPKDKKGKQKKPKKMAISIAILGGGDVVFPIILAGVVLGVWGVIPALMVSLGATIALTLLFIYSKKGKFYPAMPFITAGCLAGLLVASLI